VFLNPGVITPDDYAAWMNNWPCSSIGPSPVADSSADGQPDDDRQAQRYTSRG